MQGRYKIQPGLAAGVRRGGHESDMLFFLGRMMVFLIQIGLDKQACGDVYAKAINRPTLSERRFAPGPSNSPANKISKLD